MQSGTVLHLALLKKLSNHYPSGELACKYHLFKHTYATRCISRTPKHPPIEKYQSNDLGKPFQATYKPRNQRKQKKFQKVFQNWQFTDSVTAWNVDNQQQVIYTEKLKRDKYDFFPKLIQKERKNKIKFKKNTSVQEVVSKTDKVYNFLVEEVNNTKESTWLEDEKPKLEIKKRKDYHSEDKQNGIELRPLITGYKINRRAKSNERSIMASPLTKNINNTLYFKD